MRDFELPGRSAVYASGAMAATSHPLATGAALLVMREGGNAMDAAVAASAVLCVVEPHYAGIGGDCFVLYAPEGSDRLIAFNGSGPAPAAATIDALAARGITAIERQSAHAVTIPGTVDAWDRLVGDHGRRELGALLSPAIRLAREGYPVAPRVAADWALQAELLADDPAAARIFLPGGAPPAVGDMHRQPELADTLERIARTGRDGFYQGPVADDMVSLLQSRGGLHQPSDFAGYRGAYVEPIRTTYRDHVVHQCPPNGQGVAVLMMLNVLKGLEPPTGNEPDLEWLHHEVEIARRVFRDRDALLADPDEAGVPVDWMLSADYAARIRSSIDPRLAAGELPPPALPEHRDTVYLCVVDAERNAVSFINSTFNAFGSGLVAPATGIVFQNRGESFSLDPEHPNCIAPGKRPLHTIIPGMLSREGRAVMPFGVMGGHYQALGHVQFLSRLLDYGMDVQQALDQPRLFPRTDGSLEVEAGFPAHIAEGLAELGHRVTLPERPIGGGQAIWIDWRRNILIGGSDPRKDGCALGF